MAVRIRDDSGEQMGVTSNKQNEDLCANKTVPSLNCEDAYSNPHM